MTLKVIHGRAPLDLSPAAADSKSQSFSKAAGQAAVPNSGVAGHLAGSEAVVVAVRGTVKDSAVSGRPLSEESASRQASRIASRIRQDGSLDAYVRLGGKAVSR